jgi:competence protein ComEA
VSASTDTEAAPVAVSEPGPAGKQAPAPLSVVIDINAAALAELDLLPGIGPVMARRIIDNREKAGPFKTVDDLGRVRGIGPKTIERLRAHVRVE